MSDFLATNTRSRDYDIQVAAFDGPLDLLLHLIERAELDITAISLATVTDQYLAQVRALDDNRVSEMIDFIVVGARLMVIKSRALLPLPPDPVVGEEEEDPAEALLRQLRAYQRYRTGAAWLQAREVEGLRTFLRIAPPQRRPPPLLDLSGVSAETLLSAMIEVLTRLDARQDSVSVSRRRTLTIEDQIHHLRRAIRMHQAITFDTLLSPEATRTELSVTLLAVLEMIKRREIVAAQPEMFGPIEIARAMAEPTGDDTPS